MSTTDTDMEGISSSNEILAQIAALATSGIGTSQMNFANRHDDPISLGGALPRRRFNTSGEHESTEEILPIANSTNESIVGIDPVVNSMNESKDEISTLVDSMNELRAVSVSQLRRGNLPTIYRVPQSIRQLNIDAYEPQILSIGPYHHGKINLNGMEVHKWQYLDSILRRNPNYSLESYIREIRKLEDEARSCYSGYVGYKSNEFVKMMMLDGCFIVELFLRLKEQRSEVDPVFSASWMLILIGYDMLLLENQIPFIVLQRIYEIATRYLEQSEYSLVELAFHFFLNFFREIMPTAYKVQMMDSIRRPHHLLDLFHSHLIPTQTLNNQSNLPCNPTVESKKPFFLSKVLFPCSNSAQLPISKHQTPLLPRRSTPRVTLKMIPSVTELQLAGVKFKKRVGWSSILEVKFSNGVLEIPPLSINSYAKTLFGNLLMFEQCYPKARICFMTYIIFMDCIINTSKDVALLHRNGIINHLMGSDEEVANLFNRLGHGIFDFQNNYLSDLYKDVEKHCKTKWNMWWASLRRDYFTSPWVGLATFAAVIVILATIIQTIFAILSYK